MTMLLAISRNDAFSATPRTNHRIGHIMGQLRTANKRHNRAIRALTAKAVTAKAAAPAKVVS
ncbi:hypothetical protein FHS31_001743 [Sphingomonas vulcanisoli]|uniref:Uncharacterized protein n=1 Tax=Sphingomonas vulcanisoli TaxID=1658060 RepID=A0ABX0TSS3_9SPHN|nr:hypothetical protein [Sphingomonas vulcanisoli]NIJ08133.1 hypothetical protein [Sphingomonas vulcanisoli]